jgi:hypothetical protein
MHSPSCGHIVGIWWPRPDLPCKSKVCNFNKLWPHTQQILWFHIAVKEAMTMHESQTLKDLIHHVANDRFREVFFSVRIIYNGLKY